MDGDRFLRVLGEELRELRRRHGWSRREVRERLRCVVSEQTLATYEEGTRQCSVVRFMDLCEALDESPLHVLARARQRVSIVEPQRLRLGLRTVLGDTQPELLPLRRWAEGKLRQHKATSDVELDDATIGELAAICGLSPRALKTKLLQLAGSPAHRDEGHRLSRTAEGERSERCDLSAAPSSTQKDS